MRLPARLSAAIGASREAARTQRQRAPQPCTVPLTHDLCRVRLFGQLTDPAAARTSAVTASGWETITACDEDTLLMVADARSAIHRSPAAGMALSLLGDQGPTRQRPPRGVRLGYAREGADGQWPLLEAHERGEVGGDVGGEHLREVSCLDVEIGVQTVRPGRVRERPGERGVRAEQGTRELSRVEDSGDALALVQDVRRNERQRGDVVGSASSLADHGAAVGLADQTRRDPRSSRARSGRSRRRW